MLMGPAETAGWLQSYTDIFICQIVFWPGSSSKYKLFPQTGRVISTDLVANQGLYARCRQLLCACRWGIIRLGCCNRRTFSQIWIC